MTIIADLLSDDLDVIFASEFSTEATVSPAAGGADYPLRGIYRAPYEPDRMGRMDVERRDHSFRCKTADAASVRQGDRLTIAGTAYRVTNPEPNGYGMTTLSLVSR